MANVSSLIKFKKWLDKKGINYEFRKLIGGKDICFIPVGKEDAVFKYLNRINMVYQWEYRAFYTSIAIII